MLRLQFNCLIEHINIEPHTLFDDSKTCVDKSNLLYIINIFILIVYNVFYS